MRKFQELIGLTIGVVIGLLLASVAAIYGMSTNRFKHTYNIQVEAIEIPTDQTSSEYGEHVAAIRNFITCQGYNLAN